MSAAILEAMMVQTPVLARDIKANKAIINHGGLRRLKVKDIPVSKKITGPC